MEQIPKNRNLPTHPYKGRKSKLTKEQDQQIKDTIAETPDITLLELIDKLSLDLTEGGLSFHLKAMGLTFKKRHHTNGQKRVDIVEKHNDWRELQKTLEVDKLAFLDEASINSAMTRLYGWGDKHSRVADYVPDARFERTSILATVRLSGQMLL
ncbi:hypothetical protein [Candidatus Bathycorpusculum sp.]|uniref:hypothetical protein n=1 Tax=Candidatus Bathycorpusculum sp. TaxID=2994959 RepID=UPI002823F57C|nr:hypothetical protein [Candidatus Termitimicrobium sp.]MCL2431442.1 hypothetical protein [Candidatus Termitimicrobium sp.]